MELLGCARLRRSRRSCISSCLGFVAVCNSCGVSGKTLVCLTSLYPAAVYRPRLAALCSAACRNNFIPHLTLSTIAEELELILITISSRSMVQSNRDDVCHTHLFVLVVVVCRRACVRVPWSQVPRALNRTAASLLLLVA